LALSRAEFNDLVSQHGESLYRTAYRMMGDRHEAEDMVQETFRSAWKGRQNYQPERGQRAWLAAILRRRIIDRWRRRPPPSVLSSEAPLEIHIPAEDPLASEYTDEMQAALNRLPAELRETLLLVVVADLTHQEVADMLDIPLGTVLSRVSRGRQRLREYLLATPKH
jgi:RNA polymerase sigma-70 factor (ECF subfamily)